MISRTTEYVSYREWLRVGPEDATATIERRISYATIEAVLNPTRSLPTTVQMNGEDKKSTP